MPMGSQRGIYCAAPLRCCGGSSARYQLRQYDMSAGHQVRRLGQLHLGGKLNFPPINRVSHLRKNRKYGGRQSRNFKGPLFLHRALLLLTGLYYRPGLLCATRHSSARMNHISRSEKGMIQVKVICTSVTFKNVHGTKARIENYITV